MIIVIQQMIMFFLLMSAGYALYKIGIMDADFNKKLTNLVLRFTMPCMIVASVFDASDDRDLGKVLNVFVIALIVYVMSTLLGMLIAKLIRCNKENCGIYVFMTVFSNVGFMGIPVIDAMLGGEAVFYTAIFNMIFNVFLFTVGVKAINYPNGCASGCLENPNADNSDNSKHAGEYSLKQIILHPGVISAFIALILYFVNISLPIPVESAISSVGRVTSPVAMLLMGASLAKVPVKRVFNDIRVYIFVVIKQIILPLLCWIPIKLFIHDKNILIVTLVMLSMPIANSVVMFAIEYDRDEELAAKNVFISTICSIFLFPLILSLTVY